MILRHGAAAVPPAPVPATAAAEPVPAPGPVAPDQREIFGWSHNVAFETVNILKFTRTVSIMLLFCTHDTKL